MRVAFQGEPGAFSEAAAVQLLGEAIETIPRATFDATFRAVDDGAADALLVPVENTLAGSVAAFTICCLKANWRFAVETILPIQHVLVGHPCFNHGGHSVGRVSPHGTGAVRTIFSDSSILEACSRGRYRRHVREMMGRADKSCAAIAGKRAARHYKAKVLEESIQDNAENFTRFVLLLPPDQAKLYRSAEARKISFAMRLAHRPGALLASLEPFAAHGVNLLKIESRPIHGKPFEYQFYVDVDASDTAQLEKALGEARAATSELRILGIYAAAKR